MSEQNVETVKSAYEQFAVTRTFIGDKVTHDFVWDMSNFHGWPEQQTYDGVEGAEAFLSEWIAAWDNWELEVEALKDAGDRVVVLVRQRGRSKAAGMPVDMYFAQVWTFHEGKQTRMEMYSDPDEALKAAGLAD